MANEKRLIDLDKLVANFRATKIDKVFPNWKELSCTTQAAIIRLTAKYRAIVLSQPSVDAVEVVRCKDCKWAKPSHKGWVHCTETDIILGDEEFCSCGERKEEAEPRQDCTYNRNGRCIGQKMMPECDQENCDRKKP